MHGDKVEPAGPAPRCLLQEIQRQLAAVVVGQPFLLEQLLITVVCRCHSEIEGPPGVARWLAVSSLARSLALTARKLRCSPDLQLDDLVGPTSAAAPAGAGLEGPGGPLFGNLVLADAIEWLSPRMHNRVQQAMQEHILELHGRRWELPDPFVLFAGRYPREETEGQPDETIAELHADRFLFRIAVPFPAYHEEYAMAKAQCDPPAGELLPLVGPGELAELQRRVYDVAIAPPLIHFAVRLVRATRVHEGENPDFVYEWVQRGAGPRAVHGLVLAAKARALLTGRMEVTREDLRHMVFPVLRHRIVTNRNARSNGITTERVIARLLDEIPPRVQGDDVPPRPGDSLTHHDWVAVDDPD